MQELVKSCGRPRRPLSGIQDSGQRVPPGRKVSGSASTLHHPRKEYRGVGSWTSFYETRIREYTTRVGGVDAVGGRLSGGMSVATIRFSARLGLCSQPGAGENW